MFDFQMVVQIIWDPEMNKSTNIHEQTMFFFHVRNHSFIVFNQAQLLMLLWKTQCRLTGKPLHLHSCWWAMGAIIRNHDPNSTKKGCCFFKPRIISTNGYLMKVLKCTVNTLNLPTGRLSGLKMCHYAASELRAEHDDCPPWTIKTVKIKTASRIALVPLSNKLWDSSPMLGMPSYT